MSVSRSLKGILGYGEAMSVTAVLTDAKENEIIRKNPARMIVLPNTESREQHIPNADEVDRFFRALADEPLLLHLRHLHRLPPRRALHS